MVSSWKWWACQLLPLLLAGCTFQCETSVDIPLGERDLPSEILPIIVDSMPPEKPPQKKAKTMYVIAKSGLRLRKGPSLDAESVAKLSYGESVTTGAEAPGEAAVVEGIRGMMIHVRAGEQSGYAFSGFLSSLPVPVYEDGMGKKKHEKAYFETLQDRNYAVSSTETGNTLTFRLPAASLQEAFLIARELFFIPAEYHFPQAGKTTLSTPENPSKAAKEGPYDYVTQYFVLKTDDAGAPYKLTYHDDSEVGGREIVIQPNANEGGFELQRRSFAH